MLEKVLTLFAVTAFAVAAGCTKDDSEGRIKVTATIFPLYDFAKEIGGDKVSVKLMLPPGTEAHSYEPAPGDIVRLNESDLFLYTGESMEPWAEDIIKTVKNEKLKTVEASEGIAMIKGHHHESEAHEENSSIAARDMEHNEDYDPHVWLDFENDTKIVNHIAEKLAEIDPVNSTYYKNNASEYSRKLMKLDKDYRDALGRCKIKTIIYGGHFAFGYMAKRYRLEHISPYKGFSPDAEPSPQNIADLTEKVKKLSAKYVYYEELVEPKVANVISSETGVEIMMLHGAHNLTKDEIASNKKFIDIMYENLEKLKTGLGYKK